MAEFEDFSDGSDFEEFLGFEDVDEAEYFDNEYEPIDRELWLRHMFVNDDEEEEVWNGAMGMGLLVLPVRRDYWRQSKNLFRTQFARNMSRDRFAASWRQGQ